MDAIRARIASLGATRPVVIVGITGAVAAGKSTLARELAGRTISTDSYLPDYDRVEYHRRDEPGESDLSLLASHLLMLRSGAPAPVPVWSFNTHRREGHTIVNPHPLIVCEGLHALHEAPGVHLDLRVFVEAAPDERWRRAEAREIAGERGWTVEELRQFFTTVAEPTYSRYAPHYRASADVVVQSGL